MNAPVNPGSTRRLDDRRSLAILAKRNRIVAAAVGHFAAHGYEGTRIEAIAADLGIAKGSIFAHFGSKAGLFVAAYRSAVAALPRYLDAPPAVVEAGFFAIVRHWLDETGHLVHRDWVPYRVALLGNYGTDLSIRREINRFLVDEDPYGTVAFLRFGIQRAEVRDDIPIDMLVGVVDWLMERFQDAQITAELDPGLFRRSAGGAQEAARIDQFVELLRSAIGRR